MSIIKSNMTAPPPPTGGVLSSISEMNSLRFDGSSCLEKGDSASTNASSHTLSFWMKPSDLTTQSTLFSSTHTSSPNNATYSYWWLQYNFGGTAGKFRQAARNYSVGESAGLYRDPNAWYHVVLSWAMSNSKTILYVNGHPSEEFSSGYLGNHNSWMNGYTNRIGCVNDMWSAQTNQEFYKGYLANIHYIENQALDANAFGEEISGVWVPKQYGSGDPTDTATVLSEYGQNGFHLDFADSGNIGNDASGRGNHWTVN